jgi:hypothetical protein
LFKGKNNYLCPSRSEMSSLRKGHPTEVNVVILWKGNISVLTMFLMYKVLKKDPLVAPLLNKAQIING